MGMDTVMDTAIGGIIAVMAIITDGLEGTTTIMAGGITITAAGGDGTSDRFEGAASVGRPLSWRTRLTVTPPRVRIATPLP
jgi:hypothetical protein